MEANKIKEYCLSKKGAVEDLPFGPGVLVIKVADKMFALISGRLGKINLSLKCDPLLAEDLRQLHKSITAGYHLNKKHWNTIIVDGSIPESDLLWMIDHSYELVYKSLSKVERDNL